LLVEEGERAALNFQRIDVKLCSKIKFATQAPTNRAVSIRCRIFSVTSELGHQRTSSCVPARSVDPSAADMRQLHQHVGFVPTGDISLEVVERGRDKPR